MQIPTDKKIPQAVAMILLASALAATSASAQTTPQAKPGTHDAKVEVTALLNEFLSKVDSSAMHERFWADDLIYVGNGGAVRTKAEIVKSVKDGEAKAAEAAKDAAKKPDDPKVTFGAEDMTIRQFGETAVLNFKLVQHTEGKPDQAYRNAGVLVLRNGKWQVISWQATKVPATDPEKK